MSNYAYPARIRCTNGKKYTDLFYYTTYNYNYLGEYYCYGSSVTSNGKVKVNANIGWYGSYGYDYEYRDNYKCMFSNKYTSDEGFTQSSIEKFSDNSLPYPVGKDAILVFTVDCSQLFAIASVSGTKIEWLSEYKICVPKTKLGGWYYPTNEIVYDKKNGSFKLGLKGREKTRSHTFCVIEDSSKGRYNKTVTEKYVRKGDRADFYTNHDFTFIGMFGILPLLGIYEINKKETATVFKYKNISNDYYVKDI